MTYGEAFTLKAKVVVLEWAARRVLVDDHDRVDVKTLFSGIEGNGVYVVQGCHDAHPVRTILYVGQARRALATGLGEEMRAAFGRFQEDNQLYSDVSDLSVHWARINPGSEDLLDHVEQLVIVAHAPPFNKSHARGWYEGPRELVVVNVGAKGRLHPSITALYHSDEGWPTTA